MRKLISVAVIAGAAFLLSGCYYTSPAPLISESASSCGGISGNWAVFDPVAMQRARSAGQRPTPAALAVFAQSVSGCRLQVRSRADSGLPATNLAGANRDLSGFFAATPISLGQSMPSGASAYLVQVRPSAAPGVNFGVSASTLYAIAMRVDTPQGSMLTIVRPVCAQSSCTITSISQARSIVEAMGQQRDASNVVAVLLGGA